MALLQLTRCVSCYPLKCLFLSVFAQTYRPILSNWGVSYKRELSCVSCGLAHAVCTLVHYDIPVKKNRYASYSIQMSFLIIVPPVKKGHPHKQICRVSSLFIQSNIARISVHRYPTYSIITSFPFQDFLPVQLA